MVEGLSCSFEAFIPQPYLDAKLAAPTYRQAEHKQYPLIQELWLGDFDFLE